MTTTELSVPKMTEDRFGGLSPSQLNAVEQQSLMALALTMLEEQHRPGEALTSPEDTRRLSAYPVG